MFSLIILLPLECCSWALQLTVLCARGLQARQSDVHRAVNGSEGKGQSRVFLQDLARHLCRTRVLMSAEAMPFELFENIMTNQDAREACKGPGRRGGGIGKDDDLVRLSRAGRAVGRSLVLCAGTQECAVLFGAVRRPVLCCAPCLAV
jgi:hypothetical protein